METAQPTRDNVSTRRGSWRWWWLALPAALIVLVVALLLDSPVKRAGKVRIGMTRSEVLRIMGASQLHYKADIKIDGVKRLASGVCWDHGGVPKAFFDHSRRKLGLLESFKTREDYPVEIRFDGSDRVEAIEIRESVK